MEMWKMKKLIELLFLMILNFQVIFSIDEVSQNSILERLDSIEAVQELNSLKIEQVETLFTGLKGKVERLEIKNKEIFGDLGKLDRKIADVSSSVSSLSLYKITDQHLQPNNGGLQLELGADEITKYAVSDSGPSSCRDLKNIGHNLEGFYTIPFNTKVMRIIYCGFYGKIASKMNPTTITIPPTSKLAPTLKSEGKLPLNHDEGKSYNLMNNKGKCLAVETTGKMHPSENGAKIIQSTCNPTEKGQLWKYDKQKYLLCNDWNKCLSTPLISPRNGEPVDVFHWDLNDIKKVKALWNILVQSGHIYNLHLDLCLSIEGNNLDNDNGGERAITSNCNAADKGQIWSFVQN